jgi:hypothetical protein
MDVYLYINNNLRSDLIGTSKDERYLNYQMLSDLEFYTDFERLEQKNEPKKEQKEEIKKKTGGNKIQDPIVFLL